MVPRITARAGLPDIRKHGGFLFALLIDSLGTGLFVPFSLLYFNTVAHISISSAGFALSIATFATLPFTPITGALVDRLGAKRLVVASQLLQAVGFVGYLLVSNVPILVVTALLVTGGTRIFFASFSTLIAQMAAPSERTRWYGLVGIMQTIGGGFGGLAAGWIVASGGVAGYYAIVVANVISFLIAAALIFFRVQEARHTVRSDSEDKGYGVILQDRIFLGMTVANVMFTLCALMLGVGMAVYAIKALGVPAWFIGSSSALSTAIVVGLQTFTVRILETRRRTSALFTAGLIWASAFGLLVLALVMPGSILIPYLFVSVAIYAFGSLLYAPTATALAAAMGPENLRGRYIATFELSWGIASAIAPGMFGALFSLDAALPWTVLGALSLVASLIIFRLRSMVPDSANIGKR